MVGPIMSKLLWNKGLSYIPIPLGQKGPTTLGWNRPENCITAQEDALKLKNKNVGIALAYCEPVVACFDIDDGRLTKRAFEHNHLNLLDILKSSGAVFASGRSNSLKALYTLPDNIGPLVTKQHKNENTTIYELRCASKNGLTAQDVIPPSIHPSGSQYTWLQGGLDSIKPMPECLLEHWLKLLEGEKSSAISTNETLTLPNDYIPTFEAETPQRVALLRDQLHYINPDCHYTLWRDVIWGVLSTGYESATGIAMEWSLKAPHRWNEEKFISIVNGWSPDRYGPTLGTIYHYARQGGWNG